MIENNAKTVLNFNNFFTYKDRQFTLRTVQFTKGNNSMYYAIFQVKWLGVPAQHYFQLVLFTLSVNYFIKKNKNAKNNL